MNSLFHQLATHRGFVIFRLAKTPKGGLDKIPVDPITGYNSNAQDASTWMTPDVAQSCADAFGPGYGVGIVIYAGSQLFCIDIDHCIENGGWSAHAQSVVARFPGAFVEVSASGTGLHIFGAYRGQMPPHAKKNSAWATELYTEGRFIALMGTDARGALVDCTEALFAFAAEYFPHKGGEYGGEWTDHPADGWDFLTDDDELLAWAATFRDAKSAFGAKAPVNLLMGADDSLGHWFPPNKAGEFYDASSADQAMANFFAWATGNNCDRVAILMRRTALARPKWERDDYLHGTIAKACAGAKSWPTRRPSTPANATPTVPTPHVEVNPQPHIPAPPAAVASQTAVVPPVPPAAVASQTAVVPPVPPVTADSTPEGHKPKAGDYLTLEQQKTLWAGCVYIRDLDGVLMPAPKGGVLKEKQFNATYGGLTFQVQIDGSNPAKKAWDAFIYSEIHQFPRAEGLMFDPREAPGAFINRDGLEYINTWLELDIHSEPGDVQWFLDHIKRLWPAGDDATILVSYLKFMVQHKGHKAAWAPFLQGVEGNGKSFISATMTYCIGQKYTHALRASQLDSRFNSQMYQKLFYPIEDMHTADNKGALWETLKPMITERFLEIEGKGFASVVREMCGNFILNSNHKDGVRKTGNDRRIAPFFAAQQKKSDLTRDGLTPEYFTALWGRAQAGGWANVLHYLKTDPIVAEYNPAVGATIAPLTSSTSQAITAGLGTAEQEILDAIEAGAEGFMGGWINSIRLDGLLKVAGKDKAIPKNKRRDILESLGYIPHPGLPDGRLSVVLLDGTKPRLYIREGHPSEGLREPVAIRDMYYLAQKTP